MPDAHNEDDKPQLIIHEGDLPASVRILRELLAQSGSLFDRGRVLVEVKRDADGTLFSRPMQVSNVIVLAHEFCQPVIFDRKRNLRPVTLPDRAARMYLELGEWGLQPLAGISTSPLLRADGTITSTNGYDRHSQLFCDASPAVEVPDGPSEADAQCALAALRDPFKTFPFADAVMLKGAEGVPIVDVSQPPGYAEACYLAGVLTAVARSSLWTAPGLLITAPKISGAGSGKGLLARAAAAIAYGVRPAAFTSGESGEFEKRLGAKLLTSDPVLFADNINDRMLKNDTLASVLTERPAEIRVLGYSKMLTLNSAAFFVLTGNGLKVTEDLARRFLVVALDAKMEDPETRRFKPGFLNGIARGRTELLKAALTILRWGRQNAPGLLRGQPLGSFEVWCEWVRDPLLTLGCADPVEETLRMKRDDPQRQELSALFNKWFEFHHSDAVAASDLHQEVLDLINPHKKGRQFVARALERYVGTRMAGFVLTRSKGGKWATATYSLQRTEQQGAQPDAAPMTPAYDSTSGGHRPGHRGVETGGLLGFTPMTPITPMTSGYLRRRRKKGENGSEPEPGESIGVIGVIDPHAENPAKQDLKKSRWRDPAWQRGRAAAMSRREAMYEEWEKEGG